MIDRFCAPIRNSRMVNIVHDDMARLLEPNDQHDSSLSLQGVVFDFSLPCLHLPFIISSRDFACI